MPEFNKYAEISWTLSDVQTLRPEWTDEQAEEFLTSNAKYLRDRLIEIGWGVMETLMPLREDGEFSVVQEICPACDEDDIENPGPPEDNRLRVHCNVCGYSWTEPIATN